MRNVCNVCMPHAMGDVISGIGIAAADSIGCLHSIGLTLVMQRRPWKCCDNVYSNLTTYLPHNTIQIFGIYSKTSLTRTSKDRPRTSVLTKDRVIGPKKFVRIMRGSVF